MALEMDSVFQAGAAAQPFSLRVGVQPFTDQRCCLTSDCKNS